MKVIATLEEIRALVALAELDRAEAGSRGRAKLARAVGATLLGRYENLRETGRVPVVVPIVSGGCSGCHMRLPTVVDSHARRGDAVYACSHCGRLLYPPTLLSPPPVAVPEKPAPARPRRTRSAAGPRAHS